ncbi:hypothetical protein SUDANB121_00184 [Nocardiopsis dassonvillei]|uniref:glycosyltransferase family 9 protein n=1 Tax=Nocardiopsis dassonvillei TaxID=2014 RepID=UPI003F556F0F
MSAGTVLVARPDGMGDVLLSGPAVRAVARHADRVVYLAGPRGAGAARMLPGVDRVVVCTVPWIVADPPPVDPARMRRLVRLLAGIGIDRAVLPASFHQSPLPLALVLRMAGVPWIGGTSVDYPGSLLDVRHRPTEGLPESEQMLSLARACGMEPAADDDGLPAVRGPLPDTRELTGPDGYTVVHTGSDAPARAIPPAKAVEIVGALRDRGDRVVVTGPAGEPHSAPGVLRAPGVVDLTGRTSLPELAGVLSRAAAAVCGNTGPAHLAAAVRTPVVSLFAPVVPAAVWAPRGSRVRVLGDQHARCAGSRARVCPVPGHPCLTSVSPETVMAAVDEIQEAR